MDAAYAVAALLALLVLKFFAYTWYLRLLDRRWGASRNARGFALARMLLGAALGFVVWSVFPSARDTFLDTYFYALATGRILAWAIVLGVAFGRHARPLAIAGAVVPGVLLSYAVEIPILIGLVDAIGIC